MELGYDVFLVPAQPFVEPEAPRPGDPPRGRRRARHPRGHQYRLLSSTARETPFWSTPC